MFSSIFNLLVFIALAAVGLAFIFYRLAFSPRTVLRGRLPLLQFLFGIVFPPLALLPFFQLYRLMERKPELNLIPLGGDGFIFVFFFLVVTAALGNGMHMAAVSIDHKAKNLTSEERDLLHIIDFFHHAFSHTFIYLPVLLACFSFFLFEINHPEAAALTPLQVRILVFFGFLFGASFGLSVIEGSSYLLVTPLLAVLLTLTAVLRQKLHLDFRFLPVGVFFNSSFLSHLVFLLGWGFYHRSFPEIIGELVVREGFPENRKGGRSAKG